MVRYITKPFFLVAGGVLLLIAPVVVMTVVPGLRPADMVARHLGEEVELVPDRFVAAHQLEIAKLDLAGTDVLVQALGNPRAIVAEGAGSALHAQLDQWARMPSRESSPRVAHLANQLAAKVSLWNDAARSTAADLATRILQWPVRSRVTNRVELIADCNKVLQSAPVPSASVPSPPISSHVMQVAAEYTAGESPLPPAAVRASSASTDPRGILELPLAYTPGGDLPIREVELPPLPPSLATPPSPQPLREGVPRLLAPSGTQLPRVIFPDDRPWQDPNAVPSSPRAPHPLAPGAEEDPRAKKLAPASATQRQADQPPGLERLADLDLIGRLRGSSPAELEEVEKQLRRRGFDDRQLRQARRVVDPDPRVRRQLAESLADLRGSPSPWLFWLSYDSDPGVRQLVVSLMATTQDPRLHRRLREMRSLETDEAVRAQLERLFGEK